MGLPAFLIIPTLGTLRRIKGEESPVLHSQPALMLIEWGYAALKRNTSKPK
jgi:hypothetical protein